MARLLCPALLVPALLMTCSLLSCGNDGSNGTSGADSVAPGGSSAAVPTSEVTNPTGTGLTPSVGTLPPGPASGNAGQGNAAPPDSSSTSTATVPVGSVPANPGGSGGNPIVGTGGESSSVSGAGTGGAAGAAQEMEAESPLLAVRLRGELRDAPLGIQTATPRLSWELESSDDSARGESQTAFELQAASSLELLAADASDLWSSGRVDSSETTLRYTGQALGSTTRVFWRVRVWDQLGRLSAWSTASEFTVGLLDDADWEAQWIAATSALPLLRREFSVDKPLQRALAFVCGLGQFELRINGVNVSDAVMEPSWTNYTKNCHYVTYDVTAALAQGPNVMGVLLGNGMYNVPDNERYTKFTGSFGAPKLILRLQLEFSDGSSEAVVSDDAWTTTAGPITFSNIYGGEDFDARNEPAGWDQPGFDAAAWSPAGSAQGAAPLLIARSAPPVKVMQEFPSVAVSEPEPGVFVYDLGQNFAGWPELTVSGDAGATVRLTPGELLNGQGLVSQASSGSPVWFSYTLKGGGTEVWHPRFAYTGFRYLQVNGAVPADQAESFPDRPQIVNLSGQFIHAAAESVGTFSASDPDLNSIHALILAALRSNLQNIITDCPHREKLGWLETTHLLAPSFMFNYDVAAFYEKFIQDGSNAQTESGLIPSITPEFTVFAGDYRDSPEWGSAFVLSPWHMYQMYGDQLPLEQHYTGMKAYVDYLAGKAVGNIVSYGLGDWYDVGPAAPGRSQLTSAGVTGTATYIQDLQVLKAAAELLGNPADAAQFEGTIATTTAAFNERFLTADGFYDRNSQTANGMPLALGLVPAAQQEGVLSALIDVIAGSEYRVTAGDVGFAYVIRALAQAGRDDVIFAMLKQADAPGYLYQVGRGATSLTEAWDANPSSSQNHAMLGHIDEWFYSGLGGISPDPSGPGFKKFFVAPKPQVGLSAVDVAYHSIRGNIVSSWQVDGTGITLSVSVPVNTTATITIPTSDPASVTESGIPAATAPFVLSSSEQPEALVLEVGSGHYVFVAP